MGEKIKILSNGKFCGEHVDVELNHPLFQNGEEQIHLQAKQFRFDFNRKEYMQCALSVLVAEKNLRNLKNLKKVL